MNDEFNETNIVIDVRTVQPSERHPLIIDTFDNLQMGDHFTLMSDHDPIPLYYQFLHIRKHQFSWEYLEQGPEVWQVRIGKNLKTTGSTTL